MTTIWLGVMRYGPFAPCTFQFGKYEALTWIGVPTRSTSKEIVSVVATMLVTLASGTAGVETLGSGGGAVLPVSWVTMLVSVDQPVVPVRHVDVDALPVRGTRRRERHLPTGGVEVPRNAWLHRRLRLVLDVPDDGLVAQGRDEVAVGDLEDVPRAGHRHLGQGGHLLGLVDGAGGVGQVVLHAQELEVRDAAGDVETRVGQAAHRVARRRRELGGVDEVVGRRRRRLEVEALHRADAAVGPVRQEHQGHRRAVLAFAGVVRLPHGPTAAVLRDRRPAWPWSRRCRGSRRRGSSNRRSASVRPS